MTAIKITVQIRQVFVVLGLIVGVSCVPPTAPSNATEAQPTMTATIIIPTHTSQPTPTPLPPTQTPLSPTDEPEVVGPGIVVPPGTEAVIDGVLSPDEWEPAVQIDLHDEGQLYLMHAGGFLYLGIRAKPEPVTSICVDQKEQVSILHSSAAIGTAVYQMADGIWEQIKDFEWCCRETTDSQQAQEASSKHLQEEGWIANNGRVGNPEEVEFQIAMAEDSMRLAVNSIGAPNYRSVLSWPEGLEDNCSSLDMIGGPIPEQAQFSVEEWITLELVPD